MSERRSKWDEPADSKGSDPLSAAAAAAAAAAAKIAAQFSQAQRLGSDGGGARDSDGSGQRKESSHESEFWKDVDINDLRNRYMLTKSQTQKEIQEETGASVTTKGLWYPDRTMATEADPPLFLHVSASNKESLDKAMERINEIIQSEMPQLIEDRQAKRAEYEQRRANPPARREFVEERVPIGVDTIRNFNVRAKVVGPQGLFVKYIQGETGTRVQIKGQGSGFIESSTGYEAQEPMFIAVSGPDAAKVAEAKELAEDLIDAVRTEHAKAQQAIMQQWGGPPQHQQQYGYDAYANGYDQNGYGAAQQQPWLAGHQVQHGQPPQPQGAAPPMPNEDAPPPPPPEDSAPPPPPSNATPVAVAKKKTPEEEALDKYWRDYIEWEKSFRAYHNRLPTRDEGLQDVPPEFR